MKLEEIIHKESLKKYLSHNTNNVAVAKKYNAGAKCQSLTVRNTT